MDEQGDTNQFIPMYAQILYISGKKLKNNTEKDNGCTSNHLPP